MSTPLVIRAVFWLWLLAAAAAGHYHLLERQQLPAVQGLLLALTAALVLAYRRLRTFREWVESVDLRALVLLHATRLVGLYFLVLYWRGELPYGFAIPAGVGDTLVASTAILVVAYPFTDTARRRAISIWNVVGLADILLVVLTALRIGLSRGDELRPLTYLPLSLLPTFLVPLLIASHLAIFLRLSRQDRPSADR